MTLTGYSWTPFLLRWLLTVTFGDDSLNIVNHGHKRVSLARKEGSSSGHKTPPQDGASYSNFQPYRTCTWLLTVYVHSTSLLGKARAQLVRSRHCQTTLKRHSLISSGQHLHLSSLKMCLALESASSTPQEARNARWLTSPQARAQTMADGDLLEDETFMELFLHSPTSASWNCLTNTLIELKSLCSTPCSTVKLQGSKNEWSWENAVNF